ncbi:uncharacterized protein LOC128214320 [Mya arenaria]|uniref:uncharacterized protein LOC128214320 n=1 Tax=Mya arenaria TaxID=6604 RepID=UPI0022E24A32|nr:uncharacterized protein LOC128214320 [Mya arenaria]XP_052776691.1 uncharacterized protein LOC128214320 [Mya arenaria]
MISHCFDRKYKVRKVFASITAILICCYVIVSNWRWKLREETEYPIEEWMYHPLIACDGNLRAFGHEFVRMGNVKVQGINSAKDKSHKFTKFRFAIPCKDKIPYYRFRYMEEGPLQEWMSELSTFPTDQVYSVSRTRPTFVIQRIEAHNLYHTLCEWFNVFMVSKFLVLDPSSVDILLLDDRPLSLLDNTWDQLYGSIYKIRDISQDDVFKTLVWNIIGYNSPLNFHNLRRVPLINEFHNFFLKAYSIEEKRSFDCGKLDVTIIWRRDYLTHPERQEETQGLVHRKFKNEDEILSVVKSVFSNAHIKTLILENLTMKEQLEVMSKTDVLIGMHGAGMAHIMFLPKHAVVLEFFPTYWGFLRNFKAIADWRNIKYFGWKNKDEANEYKGFYTRIPKQIVLEYATKAKSHLCHE